MIGVAYPTSIMDTPCYRFDTQISHASAGIELPVNDLDRENGFAAEDPRPPAARGRPRRLRPNRQTARKYRGRPRAAGGRDARSKAILAV